MSSGVEIEVIPPILGADIGGFVMVEWDATAKVTKVTLGGGFNNDTRLSAASLLEKAMRELEGDS